MWASNDDDLRWANIPAARLRYPIDHVEIHRRARRLQAEALSEIARKLVAKLRGWFGAPGQIKATPVAPIDAPRYQAELAHAERVARNLVAVGRALRLVAKRVAQPLIEWRQRHATFNELMSLDDRTLADIGISRADIPRVAAGFDLSVERITPRITVDPLAAKATNSNEPKLAA
jgi:uncharacterized protein YjiS (DUF1127 family)